MKKAATGQTRFAWIEPFVVEEASGQLAFRATEEEPLFFADAHCGGVAESHTVDATTERPEEDRK